MNLDGKRKKSDLTDLRRWFSRRDSCSKRTRKPEKEQMYNKQQEGILKRIR